jgi:hypothetical protein
MSPANGSNVSHTNSLTAAKSWMIALAKSMSGHLSLSLDRRARNLLSLAWLLLNLFLLTCRAGWSSSSFSLLLSSLELSDSKVHEP